jgi:Acetyltransferase (GNAT) family
MTRLCRRGSPGHHPAAAGTPGRNRPSWIRARLRLSHHSWQRRGLGTVLLRELAQRAAEEGIRYFVADILAENQPMVTLAQRLGDAEITGHGDTVSARIDLTEGTEQADTSSYDGYDLLRAAARGEFIALPAVLRGWLDLSEKIIATLLVPVRAFCDTSREAASTATATGRPEDPATTSQKLPRSNS